jgi:hypothetical protein
MTSEETIELLNQARNEIRGLRREIERLAPRAEAYDGIIRILDLLPRRSQGASVDVAWLIDRAIDGMMRQEPPSGDGG